MFQLTTTHTYRALALIAVLSLWYVPHGDAHAQGIGIKVQPSTIEERLDPGESMTGALTVTNENGGKQTYYIGTRNIVSQNEGGSPVFSDIPSTDPMEAGSWIIPSLESVSLEVGESATIPYTITVPDNASPGSYFAAIFVTREADEVTESGTGVGFQVASIAILRVNGSVVEGLTVNEFSTDRSAYKNRTVEFSARMTNTGTVHQRPLGIISVTDMLGNELEPVLQLNEVGRCRDAEGGTSLHRCVGAGRLCVWTLHRDLEYGVRGNRSSNYCKQNYVLGVSYERNWHRHRHHPGASYQYHARSTEVCSLCSRTGRSTGTHARGRPDRIISEAFDAYAHVAVSSRCPHVHSSGCVLRLRAVQY